MITRDQVSEALQYIAETDEDFAEAKTEVERAGWLCKHARALMHEGTEGSVDERKNAVERSPEVRAAEERRIEAILTYEKLKARREFQALLIDTWRTVESSRRAGII